MKRLLACASFFCSRYPVGCVRVMFAAASTAALRIAKRLQKKRFSYDGNMSVTNAVAPTARTRMTK